jgi:hypothetical protein
MTITLIAAILLLLDRALLVEPEPALSRAASRNSRP